VKTEHDLRIKESHLNGVVCLFFRVQTKFSVLAITFVLIQKWYVQVERLLSRSKDKCHIYGQIEIKIDIGFHLDYFILCWWILSKPIM